MCPNRLIEIMCAMSSLQQQQEKTQNMYVHNQIVRLFIFCYPRPKLFTRLPAGKKWMKKRKRATLKSWPQSPWICLRLDLKFTIKSLANRHSQPDGTEENRKKQKGEEPGEIDAKSSKMFPMQMLPPATPVLPMISINCAQKGECQLRFGQRTPESDYYDKILFWSGL